MAHHKYVVVYDKLQTEKLGHAYCHRLGARPVGVTDSTDLMKALDRLRWEGVKIDKLIFVTHGEPGTLFLESSVLTARRIRNEFTGRAFEDLFTPGAEVDFDGCNLAEVKEGCETGECSEFANGSVFLMTVAETFLIRGGGRACGWTSAGYGIPKLGGDVIHHFSGERVCAYINKGGTRKRLATGDEVTPGNRAQWWKVWRDGKVFYYHFLPQQIVQWFTENQKGVLRPRTEQTGRWYIENNDWLHIDWVSSEMERWDLPLFDKHQTGIAFDKGNRELDLHAKLMLLAPNMVGDIDPSGQKFPHPR
jgi:hypothetical protein